MTDFELQLGDVGRPLEKVGNLESISQNCRELFGIFGNYLIIITWEVRRTRE